MWLDQTRGSRYSQKMLRTEESKMQGTVTGEVFRRVIQEDLESRLYSQEAKEF